MGVGYLKTFDQLGKGRKQCPKCEAIVAARCQICVCGREFVRGETTKSENDKWEIKDDSLRIYAACLSGSGCRIVFTPSGVCGARLAHFDKYSVHRYCEEVVAEGIEKKLVYTKGAIKYFGRKHVDINGKRWATFSNWVDEWVANVIGFVEEKS